MMMGSCWAKLKPDDRIRLFIRGLNERRDDPAKKPLERIQKHLELVLLGMRLVFRNA